MLRLKEHYHPSSRFNISKTVKSNFTADIIQGKHHLYVYCELVQPHIVDNVKVYLLRIVNVEKGDIVTKVYEYIQQFPVLTKKFDIIEINIKEDMKAAIALNHVQKIVTLHFRQKVQKRLNFKKCFSIDCDYKVSTLLSEQNIAVIINVMRNIISIRLEMVFQGFMAPVTNVELD